MKKRLLAVALVVALVFSLNVNAFARWNSTESCEPRLSITGSTATCKLEVETNNSSDKISAKLELKNPSGRVVKTFGGLTGTGYLSYSNTYSPVSTGTYTLVATVTVTGTNGNDTIVVSTSVTKW